MLGGLDGLSRIQAKSKNRQVRVENEPTDALILKDMAIDTINKTLCVEVLHFTSIPKILLDKIPIPTIPQTPIVPCSSLSPTYPLGETSTRNFLYPLLAPHKLKLCFTNRLDIRIVPREAHDKRNRHEQGIVDVQRPFVRVKITVL